MSSSMGTSLPSIKKSIGSTIRKIIKVIKFFLDILKKPSEEAGKTDSDDSLENIERITQIFTDFKEQIHLRAIEVEKVVVDEVDYYVEELHDILMENDGKVTKYGIHTKRIDRQIDRISSRVKGAIDNKLSKEVSLDNSECRKVVRMIPGAKKESAMAEFFSRSVKRALHVCCTVLHWCLDELYDDVETEIIGTVESIQKHTEQLQSSFRAIDKSNYEETAKKQMVDAYYLTDICDLVLKLL